MPLEPVPFGRYRLLNLLGEGGMAKVFRAILSGPMGFEKEVALKRIDQKLTEDERVVKALINEARLGGQLRHKNIVEIYEFNEVEGNYFMAMEYVDGWTLDQVLRSCRGNGEKLPGSVVAEMLISVCRGLEYAHTLISKDGQPLNLVHRDLKPGNIIVSREGDVKIMDFGIAKADTNLYKTTAADVTKGTPIYMSPEQVTGGKLDCRSDLFSLGSILHELTTLQVPFVGDNLLAIMHAILNADIDDARARVKKRFPQLEPILVKCMARNPEERYGSAKELERALRGILRSLPPGPTMLEWVEDFEANLPAAAATGEFGPDGAPYAQHGKPTEGTQSLATVNTREGAAAQPPRITEDLPEIAASEELFDSFGETMAVEKRGDPDGTLNTKEAAFFDTNDGAPNVQRTRAVPPVRGRRKKKAKAKSPALIALASLFFVVILGAAGLIALQVLKNDPAPTSDPMIVESPTASLAEEPTAAPEDGLGSLASDATAAPVEAATPRRSPTPKPPKRQPTPKKEPVVAKPDRTPAPTPAPKPVEEAPVAVVGTGTVSLNSKPWSTVIVDGRVLGSTPVQGHELPAGKHTVVFDCSACTPPAKSSVVVEVKPGQLTKKIVRF